MAGFFFVLLRAGWHPGDAGGPGAPAAPRVRDGHNDDVLRHDRRADRDRVRRPHRPRVAALGRRLHEPSAALGDRFELVLAAILIYVPPFQSLLATAALSPTELLFALPFPFIVWGADELRRYLIRTRASRQSHAVGPAPTT